MQRLGPRGYRRSVFQSLGDELRRSGLFDEVRSRASVDLASGLDNPASADPWLGPAYIDELFSIVAALRGPDGVRELNYQSAKRGGFRAVLEPIIQVSASILGVGPGSIFARAETMMSVITRGFEARWSPTSASSGTLRLRCEDPVMELIWTGWEGIALWGCELAGARGTVARARPSADGRSCEIDISWEKESRG
jgi:hypothetical protein